MAVKTTRYITFEDRVFEIRDLMRLANVLEGQVSGEPGRGSGLSAKSHLRTVTTLKASRRGVRRRRADPAKPPSQDRHGALLVIGCPHQYPPPLRRFGIAVRELHNHQRRRRQMGQRKLHNLEDALRKVPPQDFWWKRHRAVFVAIYALALACALEILGQL